MRPSDYAPDAPGRLVRSVFPPVPPERESHWTFQPNALPPDLSYSGELVSILSSADQALGRLGAIGRFLPNPHLLIRPFVSQEAVLSSRIEGTVTRLDQLLFYEAGVTEQAPSDDLTEVANYVEALDLGLKYLADGVPLGLYVLKQVHHRLMQGVRGERKRPGQFRDCVVLLGRSSDPRLAQFIPPDPIMIQPLLEDLERYVQNPHAAPIVVQLAVAHYQFETIHPFMDGNGRLGRLLITLMLCARGVLTQPLLYLSAYLERHDDEYRDRMLAVSQRGEWGEWVRFVALGVAEQADDAADRARRLLELWQEYRKLAQDNNRPSAVLALIDKLFAAPALTVNGAKEVMGVAYPTANRHVKWLEAQGILVEQPANGGRNRVYVAPKLFELIGAKLPAAGES